MAKRPIDAVRTANAIYSLETDQRIETLTYTGTSDFKGTGNRADNVITGNIGNDTLDGLTGADTLIGGKGDDSYVIDDEGDVVTEKTGEGTDEVRATLSTYTLASLTNVENLSYTGTAAFHGTGNGSNNVIRGGDGDDRLDGGSGADTMIGGKGDDTYIVDDLGDVVSEAEGEGIDTIMTQIVGPLRWTDQFLSEFSLVNLPNTENLSYAGTISARFEGTGNDLDNVITGGQNHDTLDGVAGSDTLIGGGGNDTYFIDGDDVVIELEDGSEDYVYTSLDTFNLADVKNVENLSPSHNRDFLGYGTDENNVFYTKAGNDTIYGYGGDDFFIGSYGNDSLVGGAGDDAFLELDGPGLSYVSYGNDTIIGGAGNDSANGGSDDDVIWGDDSDSDAGADDLWGGGGNDSLFGLAGNDRIFGDSNDLKTGNDLLQGGRGSDYLNGGDGNDRLESANGMGGDEGDVDTMYGGNGTDIFVYQAGGIAIIEDFQDGETLILSFRDVLDTSDIHVAYDDTTKDSTITFDGYDSSLNHVVMYDFDATTLDMSTYGSDLMLA